MKQFWFGLLSAGALLVSSSLALADTSFYIEIGKDLSKEESQKKWDELAGKFKTLSKLHYYPKHLVDVDESADTRIQAGPIDSKDKAQKVCSRLFKAGVPCFVIEGLDGAPPSAAINISEGSAKVIQLPWLKSADVAPAPAAPIQQLPVKGDEPEKAEAPKKKAPEPKEEAKAEEEPKQDEAKQEERQADVKVEEAIRVPLSQTENMPAEAAVKVKSLPEIKDGRGGDSKYADESADSGSGWLIVESFPSEDIATSFWEEVRHSSKAAKKLRVRIIGPATSHSASITSLNVGAFASSAEAYNFCREGIQARARGLTCRFSLSEPGLDTYLSAPKSSSSTDRHKPSENPPPAAMIKQYWLQLGTAPSQEEAVQLWNDIRSKNGDLVDGMRNSISASAHDQNTFVVRVGPLDTPADATAACGRMQERGIDCKVVPYLAAKQ